MVKENRIIGRIYPRRRRGTKGEGPGGEARKGGRSAPATAWDAPGHAAAADGGAGISAGPPRASLPGTARTPTFPAPPLTR